MRILSAIAEFESNVASAVVSCNVEQREALHLRFLCISEKTEIRNA